MSEQATITTDPVVEAAAVRERGIAHLAQLREEAAARRAERDRTDRAEDVRLQAAEAEFAVVVAARQRAAQLTQARETHAKAVNPKHAALAAIRIAPPPLAFS